MSEGPTTISDVQPSPWVSCPRCGEIWMQLIGVLERGHWATGLDGKEVYVIDFSRPPRVGGYRSAAPEIVCTSCTYGFGLADVGYSDSGTGRVDPEEDSDG